MIKIRIPVGGYDAVKESLRLNGRSLGMDYAFDYDKDSKSYDFFFTKQALNENIRAAIMLAKLKG